MQRNVIFGLSALVLILGVTTAIGFSEDEKPKPMSPQELQGKMMQWAQPAAHHKHLEFFVGEWKASGQMWMGPQAVPISGESTVAWTIGKRFIETKYSGPFMGTPFNGHALTGYDNGKGEYQSIWIMNFSTAIDVMTGSYDAEKKLFTWTGGTYMPDTKTWPKRETMQIKDADTYVQSMYSTNPHTGKESKELELTYKRVKAAAEPK